VFPNDIGPELGLTDDQQMSPTLPSLLFCLSIFFYQSDRDHVEKIDHDQ
jgi:hypothetical protein